MHCARGRVSEANRTAGLALRPEIVPGTLWQRKRLRAGSIPPLRIDFMFWANRDGRRHPDDRRAGCPHPAAPRGNINARGRAMALPYKPRRAANQPGNRKPSRRCKLL